MRKISRTRSRSQGDASIRSDQADSPPPGIPGATVTSKPVDFDFDLSNLLLRSTAPATITGTGTRAGIGAGIGAEKSANRAASSTAVEDEAKETVSLSDGTRITFVTTH